MSKKKLPPVAPQGYEWIHDQWKPKPKEEKESKNASSKEKE